MIRSISSFPRSVVLRLGNRNYQIQQVLRNNIHQQCAVQKLVTVCSKGGNNESQSLKNRFVPQHVRFIQTTAQLLEVVKVPPFADSVSEGDVKFDKKVGDAVAADEIVMEIETDKTTWRPITNSWYY